MNRAQALAQCAPAAAPAAAQVPAGSAPRAANADNWLSARQIADLCLAGLPATVRGVQLRADAEGWPWQERAARGGGRLYGLHGLPQAARDDFLARQADAPAADRRARGRPRGGGFFARHPDMAEAVEAFLADRRVSARNLMKLLAASGFAELPARRTLQRFVQDLEARKEVLFTSVRDPDRYKSQYRLALGRMDATVTAAHEMWEIDTTKADVHCTDGRWSVLGVIDRWSRRARFLVVASESAQSVRRMLVTTIAAWGCMPAVLKVDNGSGFINASVTTALELLGIALEPCLPGTPEDKPHVERLFGTFTRDRASLLKGFAGHSVADAQKLRARAKKKTGRAEIEAGISSAQLQAVLDAWVDGEYHLRPHSTLRMSPMEKWHRSPRPARAAPDEAQLKLALSAYVGVATVTKRGIRWKNGRYWCASLVPHMGRQVVLRRDEDDLGAIFVFDAEGRYIDTAVNAQRSGLSEQQFALAARAHQKAHMAREKAELRRKQQLFSFEKAVDQLLRDEAEQAGKLVHLPMPTVPHVTATLASIAAAPPPLPADAARLDDVLARTEPAPVDTRSPERKTADTDATLAAAARGEPVDPAELLKANLYAGSSEYRAVKFVTGDFVRADMDALSRRQGGA